MNPKSIKNRPKIDPKSTKITAGAKNVAHFVLGAVLEASWRRLGSVLEASWRRLGGEDREMARESQLRKQKCAFRSRVVTSTLKKHRKTRGGPEKKLGCLERKPHFYTEKLAIRVLRPDAEEGLPALRGGPPQGPGPPGRTHADLRGGPKTLDASLIVRILPPSCLILSLILFFCI